MTLSERRQVLKLTRALFPDEVEKYPHQVCCKACEYQVDEWNKLIWRVYRALIQTGFL